VRDCRQLNLNLNLYRPPMLLGPPATRGTARALLAPRRGPLGRVRWRSAAAPAAQQQGDRADGEAPQRARRQPGCSPPRPNEPPPRAAAPPGDVAPLRIAVVGAGFAGLATCWHLLVRCPACGARSAAPPARPAARPAGHPAGQLGPSAPCLLPPQDQAGAHPGRPVQLELLDAVGLGGGGSGAAAGLLHPYTPKGKVRAPGGLGAWAWGPGSLGLSRAACWAAGRPAAGC
jgi:hypothetical protein